MQRHLHRTRWFKKLRRLVLKLNAFCYPILADNVKIKFAPQLHEKYDEKC